MNIEYKRDLNGNYLIIECDVKENNKNYQYEMLANNEIEGFLKCDIRYVNSKTRLYFDITSKQPFARLVSRKQLEYKDICIIIRQLISSVKITDDFLLNDNNIIFDIDFVYINVDSYKLYFCYFPEWNKDAFVGIREFIEYLMQNTNHNDRKATELIYELYKRTLEESFEIDEFEKVINAEKADTIEKNTALEEINTDDDEKIPPQDIPDKKGYSKVKLNDSRLNMIIGIMLFGFMLFFLLKKITRFIDADKIYYLPVILAVVGIVAVIIILMRKKKNTKKENNNQINRVKTKMFQDNVENSDSCVNIGDTCLLEQIGEESHCLFNKKTNEKIILSKYPFILGKHEDFADGIINDSYVSRMHFQINYEHGLFFIKDLNSTNGTFVNGIELSPGVEAQLKESDVIRVGNTEYVFS